MVNEYGSGPSSSPPPPIYPPTPPSPPPATDMKLWLALLAVISVACGVLSLMVVLWNHKILRKKAADDPTYRMHRHGRSVTTPFRSATRGRGPRLRAAGTSGPKAFGTPAREALWMVQPYSPYFLSDHAVVKQLQEDGKKDGTGQPLQKSLVSHQAAMRFQKSIRKTVHAALLADRLAHVRAASREDLLAHAVLTRIPLGASFASNVSSARTDDGAWPTATAGYDSLEPLTPEPPTSVPQPPEVDSLEA